MRHVTGNDCSLEKVDQIIPNKIAVFSVIIFLILLCEQIRKITNTLKWPIDFTVYLSLTTMSNNFVYSIQQKRKIVTTVEKIEDMQNFTDTKVMQWVQYEYVYSTYVQLTSFRKIFCE